MRAMIYMREHVAYVIYTRSTSVCLYVWNLSLYHVAMFMCLVGLITFILMIPRRVYAQGFLEWLNAPPLP